MAGKAFLYIAASLDGFIAAPNDDLSFLDAVHIEGEDYGYADFVKKIDAVVVGRKTYDKVVSMGVEFPHGDKPMYVVTRTPQKPKGAIVFYNDDPAILVKKLKADGKNVYIDGGAELIHQLLTGGLIDEMIVSIIPMLLGAGVRLFQAGVPLQKLRLLGSAAYPSGLVKLHYGPANG